MRLERDSTILWMQGRDDMHKHELIKHIGSIEQIGGIREFTLHSGKAKGIRAIEINTGCLRFTVLADRCMDIAQADFRGSAVSWISKTGITAPQYYEKDGANWLRGFFGGLLTTCGLKNIGDAFGDQGLHGRIANTPADKVGIFAEWVGDDYVMKVTGEMRESAVFGENLLLKRTITAKLFEACFTVEDTVINEGFCAENIALCYHCNFGYPLVREGATILNVPGAVADITAPIHKKQEECIPIDFAGETVTVGIENADMTALLTYNRNTLPDFVLWKMLGEGDYAIGLEPRTTALEGREIAAKHQYVVLEPFEAYQTKLQFSFISK